MPIDAPIFWMKSGSDPAPADPAALEGLMDAAAYQAFLQEPGA